MDQILVKNKKSKKRDFPQFLNSFISNAAQEIPKSEALKNDVLAKNRVILESEISTPNLKIDRDSSELKISDSDASG